MVTLKFITVMAFKALRVDVSKLYLSEFYAH